MKIFSVEPKELFNDELIELTFKFSIEKLSEKEESDDDFPYADEIFSVNLGEIDKFESRFVYQSRFLVFKDGDKLNFNGYAPDFARKSNVIKDKNGNSKFNLNQTYSVKLQITKYRVYISIDEGLAKTSYGNGRNVVSDVAFYARKGVEVKLSDVEFKELPMPKIYVDENILKFIDEELITSYRSYHVGFDGVYFDRLSIEQNIKCTTRNSGAYQSGVCIDVYTNAKEISLEYEVTDIPCEKWPTQFGFKINGERIEREIKLTDKDNVYIDTFVIPENLSGYNRVTIDFPYSVALALRKIKFSENAKFKKVEKDGWMYFYGDSITEGSECFDPSAVYVSQVAFAYNYHRLDQAVSGRTFNDYNVLGEYFNNPQYVFIANGTNSFCSGVGEKESIFRDMENNMKIVIESAKKEFPTAKIIGLLPIWRSDEKGEKFSLLETSKKIAEIYARYEDISVIDCHEFVPFDSDYFSSSELAIHPNSKGHDEYAKNLLNALKTVIGEPKKRNDKELAQKAFE